VKRKVVEDVDVEQRYREMWILTGTAREFGDKQQLIVHQLSG